MLHTFTERTGLHCQPTLPRGAVPAAMAPPIYHLKGVVDLHGPACPSALQRWATHAKGGAGFYRFYSVAAGSLPLLAAPGLTEQRLLVAASLLEGLLVESAREPQRLLPALASAGVRVALVARDADDPARAWRSNPEVLRDFATGLGGASRLFPTVGAQLDGTCSSWIELLEEVFHTVQYVVLTPREVCLYHLAYGEAVTAGRYRPEELEEGGEPVPTLQADEYFAAAFISWMGQTLNLEEYSVAGNGPTGTGREHLLVADPFAFCLLSNIFLANSSWTPCDDGPLRDFPNRPVEYDAEWCSKLLLSKIHQCPNTLTTWPEARRRNIGTRLASILAQPSTIVGMALALLVLAALIGRLFFVFRRWQRKRINYIYGPVPPLSNDGIVIGSARTVIA